MSHFQRHQAFCESSHLYPKTLLRSPRPHEVHAIDKHAIYLREKDKTLFNEDLEEHSLEFLDIDVEKRKRTTCCFVYRMH